MKLLVLVPLLFIGWFILSFFSTSSYQPNEKISDGIDTLKEIKTTHLENAMSKLIKVGIVGIPGVIESTNDRTLRYLQDNNNNVTLALEQAITRMSTPLTKIKRVALTNIPFLGLPYSLIDPYWQKIRYLLLVAKLNNYDLSSQTVNDNVIYCLTNNIIHNIEQKVEHKIFGKILSYVDKFFGIKFLGKVASIPLSMLNIFLEKNNEIIECGRMKFGKVMTKEL